MSPTGRQADKAIRYMRMYGASEIMVGRRTGAYPVFTTDWSDIEARVLAWSPKK